MASASQDATKGTREQLNGSESVPDARICALDDVVLSKPPLVDFLKTLPPEIKDKACEKKKLLLDNDADWQQKWWLNFQPLPKLPEVDEIYGAQHLFTIWTTQVPSAPHEDDTSDRERSSKSELEALAMKVTRGRISKTMAQYKLRKTKPKYLKKKRASQAKAETRLSSKASLVGASDVACVPEPGSGSDVGLLKEPKKQKIIQRSPASSDSVLSTR